METRTKELRRVTSGHNALVKDLRRAFTQAVLTEDGHCAAEGVRVVEEAIRSGRKIKAVFVRESSAERANRLLPQLGAHTETLMLPDDVFDSAVPSDTPQGVAALVKIEPVALEQVLTLDGALLLAVAGLQDPGNLGTLVRSAEAFGASAVLIGSGTVSPWNPKVVRASSGSIFRMPVVSGSLVTAFEALRQREYRVMATSSHRGTLLPEVNLSGATVVVIGNEGAGIARELMPFVDETIVIPQSSKVESLNAGIAGSIILYEAARQRKLEPQRHRDTEN
jgi:RNA methyltransferase, TrmH family